MQAVALESADKSYFSQEHTKTDQGTDCLVTWEKMGVTRDLVFMDGQEATLLT